MLVLKKTRIRVNVSKNGCCFLTLILSYIGVTTRFALCIDEESCLHAKYFFQYLCYQAAIESEMHIGLLLGGKGASC